MTTPLRYRRAVETRWMYHKENTVLRGNREAVKQRSMSYLRGFATELWAEEAPGGRTMPTIKAEQGILYGGQYMSYCLGFTEIFMSRAQRNILVLTHELTHALGPSYHGKYFVKRYFPLLWKYAGYSRMFLQDLALERGIRV